MVAHLRGYKMICVMPENTSVERRQILRCSGRRSSSPRAGQRGCPGRPAAAAEHPDWVMLWYGNEANARAHYETTGPSSSRTCRASRTSWPGWAPPDPHGHRPVPAGAGPASHRGCRAPVRQLVYGLRNIDEGFVPGCTTNRLTTRFSVSSKTRCAAPELLDQEGIFAGISAGGALHAALGMAAKAQAAGERADIAFVVADGGWKYLSTGAYSGTLAEAEARLEGQLWA
jgi:cysteine synthase B